MRQQESNPIPIYIHRVRKRKLQLIIAYVLSEQIQMPPFLLSLKKISEKRKILFSIFTLLLIFIFSVCIYQIRERILHYLSEPTTVNVHIVETNQGAFPNVYIYPQSTQEFENFITKHNIIVEYKCHLKNALYLQEVDFYDARKYLSTHNYITDAQFKTKNSYINLTIKDYDSILYPSVQISSSIKHPFGNPNYKMQIKLTFPESCDTFYLQLDFSQVVYHKHAMLQTLLFTKSDYHITANLRKYHLINTKRNPCNNHLHNCFKDCFLKHINCSYPFYEGRNLPKCTNDLAYHQLNTLIDIIDYKNALKYCKCFNLCDKSQHTTSFYQQQDTNGILEVYVGNKDVPTFQEQISYTIIDLLCDIGGNIGLYFGMSCLTIVQIIYYCSKMTLIRLKKTTQLNIKRKEKIKRIQEKIKPNQTKHQYIKYIVNCLLIFLSLYLNYIKIKHYFDYPVLRNVILISDDIIRFPLIIVCEENNEIIKAKIILAEKLNSTCNNYQLQYLLHPFSKFARKPQQLWNASFNIKNYESVLYKMNTTKQMEDKKFANVSSVSTIFGVCTAFKKVDLVYNGKQTSLIFDKENVIDNECNNNEIHFILPQNQFFHPKYIYYLSNNNSNYIEINRQTIIRQNTSKSKCETHIQVSQCEEKCYITTLLQQDFNCKLPFMEWSKLPFCTTDKTAKMTTKIYLQTQFTTNPQKKCSCLPRCHETIYIPSLKQQIPSVSEKKTFYSIPTNIQEEIREEKIYSVTILLCNIGSIVAIITGFSLFSIIQKFI